MTEPRTLTDGVVLLSPLGLDDREAHLAGEDEELVRWLNGGPGTAETVDAFIRRTIQQWNSGGPMRGFGIRLGGVLTGTVELQFDRPDLPVGSANISYGIYPAFRGSGLATRAVLLACRYAAEEGAKIVLIRAEPQNVASQAVAIKAGFKAAGTVLDNGGTLFREFRFPNGTD